MDNPHRKKYVRLLPFIGYVSHQKSHLCVKKGYCQVYQIKEIMDSNTYQRISTIVCFQVETLHQTDPSIHI